MRNVEELNDKQLVMRAKNSKALRNEAIEELYRRHNEKVIGICCNILRNPDDREDAVQATWINVFRFISKFRGDCAFSSWLHTIARCEALMVLREKKKLERVILCDISNCANIVDPWAEIAVNANVRIRELKEGINSLTPLAANVIRIATLTESRKDGAAVMELVTSCFKTKLLRARQSLRYAIGWK
jgi:RNA polymerase sigma-70 factor (ECF subfamily)